VNRTIKVFVFLILLLASKSSVAQGQVVPDGILFQAVARDANNNAAGSRNIYIQIYIKKGTVTGATDYSESFKVVSTSEGIFSIIIGQGARMSGPASLKLLDWAKSLYFVNIKIAIEPTLTNPDWKADNNYVDIGTSQLWTVPYAFASETSKYADSAGTISSILPGSKGGTGVANMGKTITIANNLITKGIGDLTITTTAASNVIFPTSGTLVSREGVDTLLNKTLISTVLLGKPTAVNPDSTSADSSVATTFFVNQKVNKLISSSTSLTIGKVNVADTASMLLPYAIRSNTEASINIEKARALAVEALKVNIADTSAMLSARIARDTISLSTRIDDLTLSTRTATNLKVNIADTAAMLLPYAIRSNTEASINTEITRALAAEALKVNIADTSVMLSARIARDTISLSARIDDLTVSTRAATNLKVNIADTAAMLLPYAIRSSTEASINTEKARALAAEALKVNIADTSAMLSSRIARDTISLSARIDAREQLTNKSTSLITDSTSDTKYPSVKAVVNYIGSSITSAATPDATLTNKGKIQLAGDLGGTAASPTVSKVGGVSAAIIASLPGLIAINTTDIATNLAKQKIDSSYLSGLINNNLSSINTNKLKQQTDSATLATKIRTDSIDLVAKIVSDSTVLRGLINTNSNDITTNTNNIANNSISISQNATNIAANTLAINNRVSFSDMPTYLAPYLKIADTLGMLANYRASMIDNDYKIAALITDTATLITRFSYKENISNKSTDLLNDGSSDTKYPSVKSVKDYVDNSILTATPDATTTTKGKIQLAGDLGGIAAAPTVNSVGGSSSSTINSATLLANAATYANTAGTIVKRDANGNFNAGTITASLIGNVTGDLTGNATTATKLAATKSIYGNLFDGTADLTQAILGTYGGTGVNNGSHTITLGGNINTGKNLITTGVSNTGSDITLKTTNATILTLPTSGVLSTIDGTEALTNKTINDLTLTAAPTGFSIAGGSTNSKTLTLSGDATISGNNTGDQNIILTGDVTGVGTGTFSTTLASSGVTSGVYGGATSVPTITIDSKGRITNATSTPIIGVSSIGSYLESGKIIVGDFNNQAAKVDMVGDINIDNIGTTTILDNKITTSKILNENVTYGKIQQVSATNKILGRVSAGAGIIEEIATTGTGNVVRAISPTLTGAPQTPTPVVSSNDQTVANTEFVTRAIGNINASSVSGVLPAANGGTGIDNTGKTITLGGNLDFAKGFTTTGTTISNASDITFKTTGNTILTLPTSGTVATLSDVSASSIGGNQITGIIYPINGGTGVANDNNNLITLGGSITTGANFTTTGTTGINASNITFKTTAVSELILPTSGTLATLAGTEVLTFKTIDASSNSISNISNTNISATAAIADTKLATISTAGKVANAATTATTANTANSIVLRDVNGAFSAGSISASLNGNAATATRLATSRSVYGNTFDGTADLTQIIGTAFGGTGNGFTKFIGPSASEKVFTLPDASATVLTTNALVTVAQGGTGVSTATQNFIFAGPATGSSGGTPSFRALTAADLPSGSGSYISNSTTRQSSSNFNISGNGIAGGNMTAASFIVPAATSTQFLKGDGSLDATTYATAGANSNITSLTGLTTALSVASGGTGVNTLTANAVLLGNGTGAIQTLAPGISGNVLVSNGTTWTSQAAPASGVSTIGSISATSNVKGATVSGTTISLTPADATNGGIVTASAQSFAGAKTFEDITLSGALTGASSASSTLAGFNAAITAVSSSVTISAANAATYNGKVLVCSGGSITITFDNTVPTGFSCMILQSDTNPINFSGTNNRYNYTSTSGIYAIATAMCYAGGSVLLTGDLQ
jgi:hypothetical protein